MIRKMLVGVLTGLFVSGCCHQKYDTMYTPEEKCHVDNLLLIIKPGEDYRKIVPIPPADPNDPPIAEPLPDYNPKWR